MRNAWAVCVCLLLSAAGCRSAPDVQEYEVRGQIIAIDAERRQVLLQHEDIPGFMMAMTMPFPVQDGSLLEGKVPGDLVTATLVVGETTAYLSSITKTGHAELDIPDTPSFAPDHLEPGDAVPDAGLLDQVGAPRPLSSLRGHRVALTFIYTRCPIPDFCPLMDRHFVAVQKVIASRRDLADVRLVTVTLDPDFDTPPVLEAHATRLGANPAVWSFLTGDRDELDRFASRFGIYLQRDAHNPIDIVHNLRTVIIDPEGRLVKVHTGNSWTPAELIADLEAAPAPRR
jgi:protein SCO1